MRSRAVKLLCSAALVLSSLLPGPAGARDAVHRAPVKVYRGTFQAAEARWLVRSGREVFAYLVFAYRIDKPLKSSRTFVIADRSRCRLHGPRKRLASCSFSGRRKKVRAEALRFDPLLSGATLEHGGHRLEWVGGELQEPTLEPWVDPELLEADAYMERLSSARGVVLGDRMKHRFIDHATLSYGIYAGAMIDQGNLARTIKLTLPRSF